MGLGILCLETYWSADAADRRSVRGLLEILEHNVDDLMAVHRHVANRSDFDWYMQHDWAVDQRYDVLYVAAHGARGGLKDESEAYMSMHWIGKRLAGSCEGRVVFLAGCGTLDVSDKRLREFADGTRATAVVGYGKDVDWLESAQMDLIVLAALAKHRPGATGAWRRSPGKTLDAVHRDHVGFADRLAWGFYADDGDAWQRPRRPLADGAATAIGELSRIAIDTSVEPETRRRAVQALGALGNRGSLTTFTSIARDPRAPVRLREAAVRGLDAIPGTDAANALRRLDQRLADGGSDTGAGSVRKVVASTLSRRAA
jgi:hypothetical protein